MGKSVKVKKENSKSGKEKFWIIIAIISMTVYILWRIFFTVPEHEIYGWLATICGILLVVSETVSMLEGTEHFIHLGRKTVPLMPQVPPEKFPEVDVLIATHNEETALLYKTVNGCLHMDYPDRRKVHIYLCDDGNRAEMAALAKEMGVGYFGLAENKHAKAGNLNNAISKTGSPWIVTFDADMIPTSSFLMETIPYVFLPTMKQLEDGSWVEREEDEIDEEYKIGFIQTPQSFYNPDLFQYNFYSETRIPNEQDYFFREVNVGRNTANAPIYAGSNTVISRRALEDVGGIATGTITEDFETGIKIQAMGYTCFAIDKALAHGLAPTDVDSLVKQRVRWGRGCISSLRRVHVILNPHLRLSTKISYLSCLMYWWTFFRRFIFIISPILYILFNIPVVICSLWELILIWLPSFLLYNHALKFTSGEIRNKRWSNTVDTVIFPYMIIPILLETLFIRQTKFNVTKKTRETGGQNNLILALPQMVLLALDVAALILSVMGALRSRNYGGIIVIYWLAVNALHLTMAVFFMAGRSNLRANDRFLIQIPAHIEYMGKDIYGVTADASETGLSVILEQSPYMPHDEESMRVTLRTERYKASMQAKCMHVEKRGGQWKYGLMITELREEDRDEYFQILYDREHSLAKVMQNSVSIFDDIFLNLEKRSVTSEESKRRLPRIELNRVLCSKAGLAVTVIDTNYEYIKLQDQPELPERMELLLPGSPINILCVKDGRRAGLYRVENWKALVFEDVYSKYLFPPEAEKEAVAAI